MPTFSIEECERFWSKVTKTDSCWIWTGLLHHKGYGRFCNKYESILAHRYSYQLHKGMTDLCVCHTCDNPPCVNPAHLFEGTYNDNNQDRLKKGGYAKGEAMPNAKLTDADAAEIRRMYVPWKCSIPMLARQFGISARVIYRIIKNESWTHVPDY